MLSNVSLPSSENWRISLSNLCPDNGPPRLIRFVTSEVLPSNVVSYLDESKNLLRINKDIYDTLDVSVQYRIQKTSITTFTTSMLPRN